MVRRAGLREHPDDNPENRLLLARQLAPASGHILTNILPPGAGFFKGGLD